MQEKMGHVKTIKMLQIGDRTKNVCHQLIVAVKRGTQSFQMTTTQGRVSLAFTLASLCVTLAAM